MATQQSSAFPMARATSSGMPPEHLPVLARWIGAVSEDGARVLEVARTLAGDSTLNRPASPEERAALLPIARAAARPAPGIASSGWLAVGP